VERLETTFNTKCSVTIRASNQYLLPFVLFITHYTPLGWPDLFLFWWESFSKMSFKMWHIFISGMTTMNFPFNFTPYVPQVEPVPDLL